MTDDCLEIRAKVITAEAGELIYRLSDVRNFFERAIFALKCNQWDSNDLRPYLEQAETKAAETGDYIALIEGYRGLARENQKLESHWSSGAVVFPDGVGYHRKLAGKYKGIAERHLMRIKP